MSLVKVGGWQRDDFQMIGFITVWYVTNQATPIKNTCHIIKISEANVNVTKYCNSTNFSPLTSIINSSKLFSLELFWVERFGESENWILVSWWGTSIYYFMLIRATIHTWINQYERLFWWPVKIQTTCIQACSTNSVVTE